MYSYSNTDFPGLPVIQFLIILYIEFSSIDSTVRNRLLLQFNHFRKTYSEQRHSTVYTDFQKLHSTHSTQRNPQDSSDSTLHPEG